MKVQVEITAKVTATVECESLEELESRYADIYLYGPAPDGWDTQEDLGGYIDNVKLIKEYTEEEK